MTDYWGLLIRDVKWVVCLQPVSNWFTIWFVEFPMGSQLTSQSDTLLGSLLRSCDHCYIFFHVKTKKLLVRSWVIWGRSGVILECRITPSNQGYMPHFTNLEVFFTLFKTPLIPPFLLNIWQKMNNEQCKKTARLVKWVIPYQIEPSIKKPKPSTRYACFYSVATQLEH